MNPTQDNSRLVIRFNATVPDLHLIVYGHHDLDVYALKRCIRAHLPDDQKDSSLKLISAGHILIDAAVLASALRLPIPQPKSVQVDEDASEKTRGKRCAQEVDGLLTATSGTIYLADEALLLPSTRLQPIYIHCALSKPSLGPFPSNDDSHFPTPSTPPQRARPHPLGFDRLLPASSPNSSTLTTTDVADLRTQFRTLISARYTPDTMPSATQLLDMEERWLESDANPTGPGISSSGFEQADAGTHDGVIVDEEASSALNDALYGMLTGFFWPLGVLMWGLREDGLWSSRRNDAVLAGVLINLAFGVARAFG